MKNDFAIGLNEIDATLKELSNGLAISVVQAAARRAAEPVVAEARHILEMSPRSDAIGGNSKLSYIKRNTVIVNSKSKINPGINVFVKGDDVPVGDRFWKIGGYAVLLGEGSYKVGERQTRKTGANRGHFKGFGNWIFKAWQRKGHSAIQTFNQIIHVEVGKKLMKSSKSIGKQLSLFK